jgi:hypothetical protein
LRQRGAPVAVISLADLQLLLRLEDEEFDRIDAEDLRLLKDGSDNRDRVSWDEVKTVSRL